MPQKSIFRSLFSVFLIIIIISLGASAIYSITNFHSFIYEIEKDELIEKTVLLSSLFKKYSIEDEFDVDKFTHSGKDRLTRITIINREGLVLSDSMEDSEIMNNHLNRPEIIENINGEDKVVYRYSNTLKEMMIYYSLPIIDNNITKGFLRTSISVNQINERVRNVSITIIILSVILIMFSVVLSYYIALRFSLKINSIKKVAGFYAVGQFNNTLAENGPKELASLSKSINTMGKFLQERILAISKQKNRYKSMLESMKEPVIRLNNDTVIEEMNKSAEVIFNKKSKDVIGEQLMFLIDNNELNDFSKNCIKNAINDETMIKFDLNKDNHLLVSSSILFDAEKNKLGLLLVMNDLTEHVKLEEMRKEFVANVSHELRTPTTAIQGYIETLLNNDVSKDQMDKFLHIIYRHSNRLNSIIDDLLMLAGLEKNDSTFVMETFPLLDLVSSAVNVVTGKAEKSHIDINVICSDKHQLYAHPLLAEQALTNLLSNAIKYSAEGSTITIKSQIKNSGMLIEVIDTGCGIPLKDQGQVFQRFYRVDRARSRDQGGTGLGLSIVKRVMDIHHGEASLSSSSSGSTFKIFFPNSK